MNKNILVFGGGLAGMLTALWANKAFPNETISLLESSRVGIVGVGEGTVPSIVPFLEELDIDPLEFISETRGTFKLGIKFENWNGDGDYYYHNFDLTNPITENTNHGFLYDVYSNSNVQENEIIYANVLSEKKLSPYIIENEEITPSINYALHFDAFKVIDYLREKCYNRGVILYEGLCTEIVQNEKGVDKVRLEDGREISTDFVFDCSGFSRRIIGKEFGAKWISYEKHIPHTKAIAGPVIPEEGFEIFPYTRACAMPSGWIWQIPTMDRIGCGYVFDEEFISEDEAKHQRDNFLGKKTEIGRVIDFSAGRFEESWIKNCVAMGLSAHFIEPLEATSIWTTTQMLHRFGDVVPFLFNDENVVERFRKEYNKNFEDSNENTVAFIYYHYLTKRNDTLFWKTFRDRTEMPKRLVEVWEYSKGLPIDDSVLERYNASCQTSFPLHSWIQVGCSTNLNPNIYQKYSQHFSSEHKNKVYLEAKKVCQENVKNFLTHNQLLDLLGR